MSVAHHVMGVGRGVANTSVTVHNSTFALLQVKDRRGLEREVRSFSFTCPFPDGGCLHHQSSI